MENCHSMRDAGGGGGGGGGGGMSVKEESGGMLHDRDGQCGAIKEEDPNGALNSCGGHGGTSTGSLTRSESGEEGEMDANGIKREDTLTNILQLTSTH